MRIHPLALALSLLSVTAFAPQSNHVKVRNDVSLQAKPSDVLAPVLGAFASVALTGQVAFAEVPPVVGKFILMNFS